MEVAGLKSDTIFLEDSGKSEKRSRLNGADSPQTSLTDRQNIENTSTLKYRRYGSRLSGVKVRHKRQVLQDMARPLKHWLYKHRDNPYPTKTEKVLLALGSHMTLVQVSNWFANARRRLKNTVRQPDLSWALRIKLYNKYIQGNAERLSVCSDDTESDDEVCSLQPPISQTNFGRSTSHEKQGGALANSDDNTSPPSKYKSSLLNRYLNDSLRHVMADGIGSTCKRRNHSESFSSNDCDRDVVSPASSYETETNFLYHMDTVDYPTTKTDGSQKQKSNQAWREIHAAVALTSLAQGQLSGSDQSTAVHSAATGQSCTRETFSMSRTPITDRMRVNRPAKVPRPSTGTTLTNRIIQKSCHISEVQTVKVALANSG